MSQPARKPASRNNDLAAIHIAQKKLGLSKEDAQALKLGITGKASAADMTVPQRRMLLTLLNVGMREQINKARAAAELAHTANQ